MVKTAQETIQAEAPDAALAPMPIADEHVIEGSPQATGTILWTSADGKLANGIWECTPGVFSWLHPDETATVLSGQATVTPEGGEPISLRAGSVVFFPAGTKTRWEISDTLRKTFHLHAEGGLGL